MPRSEAECICVWILCQLVNAVMAIITEVDGSVAAESLLPLQAPSLILRRVCPPFRDADRRRSKVGIRPLSLSESLAGGKASNKGAVGGRRIFEKVFRDIPTGCQAKLKRGDHKMLSMLSNARFWLTRIAWLYGWAGSWLSDSNGPASLAKHPLPQTGFE
jgi:hypothetical protein